MNDMENQINSQNEGEFDIQLEKLIYKHSQEINMSRLKKPKNDFDFEWTSIYTKHESNKFNIDMKDKKKFEYNPKIHETIWYKNLNIPTISITKKNTAYCYQNSLNSLYAKVIAIRGLEKKIIQQTELSGEIQKKFHQDICIFNHLRFKETYFQHKRSTFSLIVIIYEMTEERKTISEIKVSSPIRVEARKKSY